MARRNYDKRLSNIRSRKTDRLLNKAIVAESFSRKDLPETVRYVYESMSPIDREYTLNTYKEAERVQNQITKGIPPGESLEFQYQGSVPLNTHILVHSDLDILSIINKFYSLEPPQIPVVPYEGDTIADLRNLRSNMQQTLSTAFPTATVNGNSAKVFHFVIRSIECH